ncbi:osmoprotectant transport system substrate-binding protein [Austwickia chelonae]|nr:ABC transporter substrate-binding protein [Austwickia chelonae]SEW40754.1 osmoprotectant transport system substrate-binding protein [Austwickia chelonae]
MKITRISGLVAAATVAVLGLAACGGGAHDPLATSTPGGVGGSPAAGQVLVGSADFSESVLLAEIYTGALKAKGVDAATKPRIGSREAYLKGLQDGSIQVMPEYTGALALFYKKDFAENDPDKVYEALQGLLPKELTVLARSAAEDKDSITVTKETAETHRLVTMSDLASKAGEFVLGAPDEFKSRSQGVPGLEKVYGINFKQVRTPLTGQAAVQALKNGQIQAANIFTTDPSITQHGFVVLQDDKRLFGTQHIVPLVTKSAATDQVRRTLDGVSAKLTTDEVRSLVSKVDVDKEDATKVAQDWLTRQGLV